LPALHCGETEQFLVEAVCRFPASYKHRWKGLTMTLHTSANATTIAFLRTGIRPHDCAAGDTLFMEISSHGRFVVEDTLFANRDTL